LLTGVKVTVMLPLFNRSVSCTLISVVNGSLVYSEYMLIGNQLQVGVASNDPFESSNLIQIARTPLFGIAGSSISYDYVVLVPLNSTLYFNSVLLGQALLAGTFLFKSSRVVIFSAQINTSVLPVVNNITFGINFNGVNANQTATFSVLPSARLLSVSPFFIVDDGVLHLVNVSL